MIAAVRGEVLVRRPDHVVIDAGGVGYRLAVSAETLKAVPAMGRETFLHAELISREDSLSLYGFASEEERDLFRELISVSGIGPKVAIAALSGGAARELLRAIAAWRHQTLSGGSWDRQTDLGADHRRAPREGLRCAGGGGRGCHDGGRRRSLAGSRWADQPRLPPLEAEQLLDGVEGEDADNSWSVPLCARPDHRRAKADERVPDIGAKRIRTPGLGDQPQTRIQDARARFSRRGPRSLPSPPDAR